MKEKKNASSMISRWNDFLSQYTFEVTHIPGIKNVLPDLLSRLYEEGNGPSVCTSEPTTIENPTVLILNPTRVFDKPSDEPIDEASILLPPSQEDEHAQETPKPETLESGTATTSLDLSQRDPLLRAGSPLPPSSEQKSLIENAHLLGHFGTQATYKRLQHDGKVWPGMKRHIAEYIRSCIPCTRFKVLKKGYHPLTSLKADSPMDHIVIDLLSGLPTTENRLNYVLVVVDVASRFTWLRAITSKSAESSSA